MDKPIVSVIIPAYNCSQYIEKAIDSVLSQEIPLEVIVIDDCSTDNLIHVINKYMELEYFTFLINENNIGVAATRNRGVEIAKGHYIAYLDADDWWKQGKLIKQIKVLETKKYALCYTGRDLVKEDGTYVGKIIHFKEVVNYEELLHHNCISCSSVVLPIAIAKEFPMCNDEFHEDYINWLKILKKYGQAYGIQEALIVYRLSKNGKSRNRLKSAKMTYGVYRVMQISFIKSFLLLCSHLVHGLKKYNIS
ncbi:glycosyltransferase family 2 protein [Anaerocolumna sp. MB42-C2]|uniref:glycosyltransferase family 2 protein n=1 Tax=Anaerocolumna sp. MB42-C2 TaxID=3070997 RepID=UPI0027E17567|nr:glycosyltransferase family 2 protein [Anaerocolumna sp. MB42-C2]WMJ89810.1 glycosyltransferase family 2 protein [Anaerocolumna sp. MB42-C2]